MSVHYWQERLIAGALLVMDICWLVLLVVTVLPPQNWAGLATRALVVSLALAATTLLARRLAASSLPWHYYDAVAIGVMVAMIVLAEIVLGRSRASLPLANNGTLFGLPPTLMVAVAVFVLWWRGFGLAQKGAEFSQVSFNFRVGSLLVLFLSALNSRPNQGYAVLLASGFFGSSLVALAASRVEAKGRDATTEQPLGPFEASLMGMVSLATVGAGLLIGALLSGGGLRFLASVLRPVVLVLLEGLILMAGWLAALFQPIADWLQRLIESQERNTVEPTPLPNPLQMQNPPEPNPLSQILAWIGTAILVLIALVVVVEFLVLLLLFLQKRQRRTRGRAAQYGAAAGASDDRGRNHLHEVVGQIRDWANLLLRYGLGPRLYTLLTVRTMYANLVRLAAARGFPRPPASTPYEYLPSLRNAFPDADADLERITDAYVAVHYGELPTSDEEMAQLRRAYERVRLSATRQPPPTVQTN